MPTSPSGTTTVAEDGCGSVDELMNRRVDPSWQPDVHEEEEQPPQWQEEEGDWQLQLAWWQQHVWHQQVLLHMQMVWWMVPWMDWHTQACLVPDSRPYVVSEKQIHTERVGVAVVQPANERDNNGGGGDEARWLEKLLSGRSVLGGDGLKERWLKAMLLKKPGG